MEKAHNQAGEFTFTWNGKDRDGNAIGSGMYFYRINFVSAQNDKISDIRKMILLR